jgi:hypothetical protein
MPLPPAMFSALAITRSTVLLAHHAGQLLVYDLPPRAADDVSQA